jgi:hypothetical protein
MASARQALMLAFTATVFAAARADGQPLAPAPLAPPDPASVLLEPVQAKPGPTQSGLDLPYDVQAPLPAPKPREEPHPVEPVGSRSEPSARPAGLRAAWLEPLPSDVAVSRSEYEDSLRSPKPAGKPATDPYDYLSDGRLKKDSGGKLVRTDRAWDSEPAPRTRSRKSNDIGDALSDGIDGLTGKGGGHKWFAQEREFDCFISPLSNPFLFEDPRSLTEVRGMMLFQSIPSGNGRFSGNANYYGLQGRLAITERWSVTLNKLGLQTLDGSTGLSEIWLGPKFELIRQPDSQTLVSVGGIFQIPTGAGSVYQNTGSLSIAPYISGAQKIFEGDWGRVNGMATAGYSISTNSNRSDYFYLSGHLDYDVMNLHKFYPLIEMNWFSVTTNGSANPNFNFEGRDMVNFGANAKGNNLLTMALGGRWRFNERWNAGMAFEFGIAGRRDIFQNRFSIDIGWRY